MLISIRGRGNMSDIKTARKNKIIETALRIFAEKGFQEATISEIAKAAGVSDATVYEYFKTKEELLFVIPEKLTGDALREFREKVLPFLRGTENKLRAIVQTYMSLYERNPHYSALVMLQLKSNRNFLKTSSYEQIRDAARELLGCIKEGIADGTFKKNIDPLLVRSMILGTIEHLCVRWHLLGSPSNLVDHVDPIIELVLDGIRADAPVREVTVHLHVSGEGVKVNDVSAAGTSREKKGTGEK
ncbi:MAG: TetR/AcrR family transcriptional regulator [Spirochaetes bacterium]|nr:MAG: TetR/AcrR family transcriptional regulator [Spirochaetota bacterium]